MATRTKKVKAAEDKDCGFMTAFKELGLEKGINPEIIFDAIEDALVAAYKRNFNSAQNVRVNLDRITGSYHVYAIKTVVDEVEDAVDHAVAHGQQRVDAADGQAVDDLLDQYVQGIPSVSLERFFLKKGQTALPLLLCVPLICRESTS